MPIEKPRHEQIFHFRGRRFSRGLAAIGLFALAAALWAPAASAQGSGSTPPVNGVPDPRNLGILTPQEYPLVKKGVRFLYDGYLDKAGGVFDQLRSLLPDSPAGELGLVLPPAVKLREDPKNPQFLDELEKGLNAVRKKAQNLLDKNPNDSRGLFYIGAVHFFRSQAHRRRRAFFRAVQELRAARKYLGRVIAQKSDAWEAYVGLGGYNYFIDALPTLGKIARRLLFLPGGDREKGLRQLNLARERSLLLGPLARNMLLVAYTAHEKRPLRAEKLGLSLHREFPNNPWFHLNLGYLYLATPENIPKAVRTFQEVLARERAGHPNYVREIAGRARLGLMAAYRRLGEGPTLRATARKVLQNPPKRPKHLVPLTRLILGEQLALDGDREGALSEFKKVARAGDWGYFGWRIRSLGFRSASDIVRRAESLRKNPPNPEAQSNGSNPRGRDRPPAEANR